MFLRALVCQGFLLGMGGLLPLAASAQPPDFERVRVITSERLSILSYVARQDTSGSLFLTQELKNRLAMMPPTDAILIAGVTPGDSDTVWYTDPATTRPNPVTVTRLEHDYLSSYAEGGLSRVFGMRSGPTTVTKLVETTGPGGTKIMVPVMVTSLVTPSEAEVQAVLDQLAQVQNPEVRRGLELAAGYKFAEFFPATASQPAPPQAMALADRYRRTVLDDAIRRLAAQPAAELPAMNEPLVFGNTQVDALSLARAVDGAEPAASFETDAGNFSAVWDKSTLVLVRQPKSATLVPGNKLKLSDEWMKALDPRNKQPAIQPFDATLIPGSPLRLRPITPGAPGRPGSP